jgi:carboxylesterase type B
MQIRVFRCLFAVQLVLLVLCEEQLARNLDDRRIVKTEYGLVQGVLKQTVLGREYLSFQGIPYMKPPLGKLRFKVPEPPAKWATTFDASWDSPGYTRYNPLKQKIVGVEDAGVINVYTTFTSRAVRLPVLVWIHGGTFYVSEAEGRYA